MAANQTNNQQKMDRAVRIIRQLLSQGKPPQEIEAYLVEQGLPQQTAVNLIKMNLKSKSQPKPSVSAPMPEPTSTIEKVAPLLKAKSPLAREKAAASYIKEQAAQGKNQSEIVDELIEHGIPQSEAIDLVVKVVGVDS